jgi:hypothetical protein
MALEIVAAPGPPPLEFALGGDVQVGAVPVCGFGLVVHAVLSLQMMVFCLKSDPPAMCKSLGACHAAVKLWTSGNWPVKGLFGPIRSP